MAEYTPDEFKLLRYLNGRHLADNSGGTRASKSPEEREILRDCGFTESQYRPMIVRFESLRLASVKAKGAWNSFVTVEPALINVVYQLDHPPTPDYRKKLTTIVNSKWWLVALIALGTVLTLAATKSEEFGKLLEWFGIKK
jgi:hypothetical protein